MKIENVLIGHSLKNGTINDLKENPDILSFILAALDHGFNVTMPGSILAKYNKVILGYHTSGKDREAWICKTNVKEVILRMPANDFKFDYLEVIRGAIYYDKQFVCTTT